MISDKALEEYKKIYKEEFGEDISDEKATGEGTALLTLMNVIYRPVKKEWLKELEEKDNPVNKAFGILFDGAEDKDIVEKINEADDLDKIKDDPDYDPNELLDRIDEIDEDKQEQILEDL